LPVKIVGEKRIMDGARDGRQYAWESSFNCKLKRSISGEGQHESEGEEMV
jgi:hypothetical protein